MYARRIVMLFVLTLTTIEMWMVSASEILYADNLTYLIRAEEIMPRCEICYRSSAYRRNRIFAPLPADVVGLHVSLGRRCHILEHGSAT